MFGEAISSKPKYVVSNTMSDPTREGSTVISGDVAAEIRKLKEQPSAELLLGSKVTFSVKTDNGLHQ